MHLILLFGLISRVPISITTLASHWFRSRQTFYPTSTLNKQHTLFAPVLLQSHLNHLISSKKQLDEQLNPSQKWVFVNFNHEHCSKLSTTDFRLLTYRNGNSWTCQCIKLFSHAISLDTWGPPKLRVSSKSLGNQGPKLSDFFRPLASLKFQHPHLHIVGCVFCEPTTSITRTFSNCT